jgi:hypothetical protein
MIYKAKVAACSEIRTKHRTQSDHHIDVWCYIKKPLAFKTLIAIWIALLCLGVQQLACITWCIAVASSFHWSWMALGFHRPQDLSLSDYRRLFCSSSTPFRSHLYPFIPLFLPHKIFPEATSSSFISLPILFCLVLILHQLSARTELQLTLANTPQRLHLKVVSVTSPWPYHL